MKTISKPINYEEQSFKFVCIACKSQLETKVKEGSVCGTFRNYICPECNHVNQICMLTQLDDLIWDYRVHERHKIEFEHEQLIRQNRTTRNRFACLWKIWYKIWDAYVIL